MLADQNGQRKSPSLGIDTPVCAPILIQNTFHYSKEIAPPLEVAPHLARHITCHCQHEPKERADQLGICAGNEMNVNNGVESGDWLARDGGVPAPKVIGD